VLQGLDENQRNTLQTETHQHLLAWCSRLHGFLRKYSDDMYLGIFSRPELDRMISEKFDILDEVRALRVGNKIPVTLSMGVAASGLTMSERGQKAQTGLDLALGRGGDQAAVYVNEEVQFYGGKAKVMEKNTRVKARVVAHAIRELMAEAARRAKLPRGTAADEGNRPDRSMLWQLFDPRRNANRKRMGCRR